MLVASVGGQTATNCTVETLVLYYMEKDCLLSLLLEKCLLLFSHRNESRSAVRIKVLHVLSFVLSVNRQFYEVGLPFLPGTVVSFCWRSEVGRPEPVLRNPVLFAGGADKPGGDFPAGTHSGQPGPPGAQAGHPAAGRPGRGLQHPPLQQLAGYHRKGEVEVRDPGPELFLVCSC